MSALKSMPSSGPCYLSVRRVCDKLSRGRTWLYRTVKNDPTFPKPIAIGGRPAWKDSDIDAWVDQQSSVWAKS